MSIGSDETIADILTEMREFADKDSQSIGRDVLRRRIQHFARRIEQSVTDCNQFGNSASMRDALEEVRFYLPHFLQYMRLHREDEEAGGYYGRILDVVNVGLSGHPRNCDVGTAEEQYERFVRWCASRNMKDCWGVGCGVSCRKCLIAWSQMPYEEVGAE